MNFPPLTRDELEAIWRTILSRLYGLDVVVFWDALEQERALTSRVAMAKAVRYANEMGLQYSLELLAQNIECGLVEIP